MNPHPTNPEEEKLVKCERCGRIRPLFQYTKFKPTERVEITKDHGVGSNPRFTREIMTVDESKVLCEECGVEINKKYYDKKELLTN